MASGGARFLTDNTTDATPSPTAAPVSTNVLDNTTNPDTECYDVKNLFGDPVGAKMSVDEEEAYTCATALIWAKEHGFAERPDFYVNYTKELFPNSSYADFQCVLFNMKGSDEKGSGQNCTRPCTSTLPECPKMGAGISSPPTNATVPEPAGGSSGSWPVWGWILLALGILGVIVGIAAMAMGGKKAEKPKKKKRAIKPPAAPPAAPEPTPAAAPVMTAPPVYVRSIQAAPTMMTAAPVYAAAPVTSAAPQAMPMATPIQTYAAPMQMATPVVMSAFDRLDTNHDGVITRAEFQQLS